jgi:hypothetical protein
VEELNVQWAAKVLRAAAEKYRYVSSKLNISGHRQDIAVVDSI